MEVTIHHFHLKADWPVRTAGTVPVAVGESGAILHNFPGNKRKRPPGNASPCDKDWLKKRKDLVFPFFV